MDDDTLACLRRVPYERIKAVIDRSPGFLDYEVSFDVLFFLFLCVTVFLSLSLSLSWSMGRIGCTVILAASCRWKIHNG